MPKNSAMKETVTISKTLEKPSKEESRKNLERFMKEELRMVKGIFKSFESPGMSTTVTFKKYPGHFFSMAMQDEEEYTIPLYVARFLNGIDITAEAIDGKINSCSYPVNTHIMDKDGNPIVNRQKRKQRFGFQSLEFSDIQKTRSE